MCAKNINNTACTFNFKSHAWLKSLFFSWNLFVLFCTWCSLSSYYPDLCKHLNQGVVRNDQNPYILFLRKFDLLDQLELIPKGNDANACTNSNYLSRYFWWKTGDGPFSQSVSLYPLTFRIQYFAVRGPWEGSSACTEWQLEQWKFTVFSPKFP